MQPIPASGPAGATNEMPAEPRSDQLRCSKGADASGQDWWRLNGEVVQCTPCCHSLLHAHAPVSLSCVTPPVWIN